MGEKGSRQHGMKQMDGAGRKSLEKRGVAFQYQMPGRRHDRGRFTQGNNFFAREMIRQ